MNELSPEEKAAYEHAQAIGWGETYLQGPWMEGGLPRVLPAELRARVISMEVARPNAGSRQVLCWNEEGARLLLEFVDKYNAETPAVQRIHIMDAERYELIEGQIVDSPGFMVTGECDGTRWARDFLSFDDPYAEEEVDRTNEMYTFTFYVGSAAGLDKGLPVWHLAERDAHIARLTPTKKKTTWWFIACSILFILYLIAITLYRMQRDGLL